MARKLDTLPARTGGGQGREAIYPWDEYMDGDVWLLTQGEDFKSTPKSFAGLARKVGYDRGHPVAIRIYDDGVALQALPNEKVRERNVNGKGSKSAAASSVKSAKGAGKAPAATGRSVKGAAKGR